MLLRIEDTDSRRFVPGAEDYIIESLKWLGIHIDAVSYTHLTLPTKRIV